MRRGDIRLVDFEPARGSEASRRRPAVIVSNDGANATAARLGRGVLTVVPVTSNTRQVYPFQVLLPSADTGLRQDSKAQAEQIRSVALERIGDQVGLMPPMLMSQLDEALRLHLELLPAALKRRRRVRVAL
jgi:mRNA interferase MazF